MTALLVTLLVSQSLLASPPDSPNSKTLCPKTLPVSAAYAEAQKKAKLALIEFANHKEVAPEADATLSKLIAAKSPAITEWIANRGTATEDAIAREWREYYAKHFLLSRYPSSKPALNAQIEAFVQRLYSQALPDAEQARIKKIFEQARQATLKWIASAALDGPNSQKIQARIKAVELVFLKKLSGSPFQKNPLEAISWGVAYDPVPNRINVGVEVLQYPSDANLFAVLTHELGHSVDSCRWGAFLEGAYPFASVVHCLRGPSSAGARTRDDSQIEEMVKAGKLSPELKAALTAHPTCNKLEYPPIGVQSDQSLEAFADWFAAEVTSQSDFAKAELRVDLCQDQRLNEGSAYPANEIRLQRIYFAHPKLRKLLPLSQDGAPVYCPLEKKS